MTHRLATAPRLVATAMCCAMSVSVVSGAAAVEQKRSYNLPSGDAATTLNQFAGASGQQIIFMMDRVKGQRTNAVSGDYAARDALDRMLVGTGLSAARDPATGAFVVSRKPPKGEVGPVSDPQPNQKTMTPKSSLARLTAALAALATSALSAQTPAPANPTLAEETINLTPFTVKATSDVGYQMNESTAGGRVRVSTFETTQLVNVVSRAFINDVGTGVILDALKYVSGVTQSTQAVGADRMTIRGFQPRAADALDQCYKLEVLADAVRALPDRCRRVIMLRYLDGHAYKLSPPYPASRPRP